MQKAIRMYLTYYAKFKVPESTPKKAAISCAKLWCNTFFFCSTAFTIPNLKIKRIS
jgi:hypothetical protein